MARGELWRDDYPHLSSVTSIITSSSQSIDHVHTHFVHVHMLENDICTVLPYQNSCHIAKLGYVSLRNSVITYSYRYPLHNFHSRYITILQRILWILRLGSDNQTPLGDFSIP
jgi:hypothetical protein